MNLYLHDCSYLFTEYGKRKSQECYDIEMRERRLDDGEQEGNEYKNVAGCPRSSVLARTNPDERHAVYSRSSAPDTKGRLKR
jgi:hypothetical protein